MMSKVRVILIALVAMFAATTVSAETLMMPKRDAKAGTAVVVWGATSQVLGGVIDFGDGSPTVAVGASYYMATTHTYATSGNFTATLTVGAESASVKIQVFNPATLTADNLRSLGINMAIQDGLRYLYQNQNQTSKNLTSITTNWPASFPAADASLIVLAFENHGYKVPNDNSTPTGIYEKYIVRRGLNYIMQTLTSQSLSAQTAGNPCVGSGPGWVGSDCLGFSSGQGDPGYVTAINTLPFAASGALLRTNFEAGGVSANRSYGEIMQRLVNTEAWGQSDSNCGAGRGGFGYQHNGCQFDGSTAGWAILGFLDAEAAGATIPAFVRTEMAIGLNNAINTDGSFDYSGDNNPAGLSSPGPQKVGIGLQGLYFSGASIPNNAARVTAVTNNINSWWNGAGGTGQDNWNCNLNNSARVQNKGCAYSMFNNFKGLKLQGIGTLPNVNRAAGPGTQLANDWYADYQDYLVSTQSSPATTAGGNWPNMGFSCCYTGTVIYSITAAVSELILSPVALVLPDEQKFSTVGLTPATHTALEGTSHTVTATAESTGGTPVPGATVVFTILTGPNAGITGSATTGSNGLATFTYTDPIGHIGTDTIQASIGNLNSNIVTATWTPLNAAPNAGDDSASTNSGTAITINVLSNDTDADHDTLTVTSATQGANGSTVINGDGTITYTPNNGFAGVDTFTYAISDGKGGTDTATVTITVTKNSVTATATGGTFVYTGAAQTGSCSFIGSDSASLTGTLTYSGGSAPVNVSSTSISCDFDGTGTNYSSASASATIDITPASSTTVVSCPASVVYSGSAQTPCTANVTGIGGLNQTVTVDYTSNTNAGTASASANFGGDANHTGSADATMFTISQAPTTTTSVNAPTIMVAANGTVTVTVASGAGTVIGNVTLTVDGGAPMTAALSGGSAIFTIASPNAGDHALVANYAAQGNFGASTGTGNLHVDPAPTSTVLTVNAPEWQLAGTTVTLTAKVTATAPGTGTPNGLVTFMEGTTVLGTGTLNAAGVATLTTTTLSNGLHTITAVYGGVNNYLTSSSNAVSKSIYGFATGGGTFVISDTNATLNKAVSFWGAQWEKNNVPTGGTSNASFKGFAMTPVVPTVGATFTSAPGNSVPQPSSVPQYIGIIVTSKVTKSGSNISGTIVKLVVVKVDAGYVADPGHAGTGTIVAFIQ